MTQRFFILAALALTMLSCNKEAEEVQGEDLSLSQDKQRIETGFTATLPGHSSSKTSLIIDSEGVGSILWSKDDPILVSNGTQSMNMYIAEGGSTFGALYATEDVFDGVDFYAIYPAEGASYDSGIFTAEIPVTQAYSEGTFSDNVFPMIAVSDAKRNFSFRNIASVIKITTSSENPEILGQKIVSVTITAGQTLSGTVSAIYHEGGDPEIECLGSKSVTVFAGEEGISVGAPVYAVVAPGSYTNLTVRVNMKSGLSFLSRISGRLNIMRSGWKALEIPLINSFIDLSEQESANCYIITEPGSYKFKATVRGNGVTTSACAAAGVTPDISDGSYIKIYNTDGVDFIDGGLTLSEDGYIYFTTREPLPTGSILLSIMNDDDVPQWSWHLWANSELEDVQLSDGSVWMNMNLGALHKDFREEGYNGYYYQWGRKDPFLQRYTTSSSPADTAPFESHASKTDGSLINSIHNPQIFYGGYHPSGVSITTEDWSSYDDDEKVYDWWNSNYTADDQRDIPASKTMFDPCPPGYHVPVYNEVGSMLALETGTWANNGNTVEGKMFFPASSYRYISIYASYWITDSPRAFFWCATPMSTEAKNHRRGYRPYFTLTSKGIGNGPRAYAVPVRCIRDGGYTPTIPVSSVTIYPETLTLIEGGVYDLVATVLPENATDKTLIWTSSNTEVATVSGGHVVAVKEGTTIVAVKAGDKTATCTVTVKKKGGNLDGTNPEDFDTDYWN